VIRQLCKLSDLFFLIIESAVNRIIFNDIGIYFETKKKDFMK